jgi:TetR/AcrR family transcriptional regulator, transcriptional repressor for nem operon
MDSIKPARPAGARIKLLEAARALVRQRGYNATSIDDLCAAAGVTKGAFFYHFNSKEALGVAAAQYWTETTSELFAAADYHKLSDPLDRLMAYIDLRSGLIDGSIEEFTCLVGTMVQESHATSDAIRQACDASISGHAKTLEADIAAAIEKYGVSIEVTPESLALHTQAVLQGGFIMAKAKGGPEMAKEAVVHLKNYIRLLFNPPEKGNNDVRS